MWVGGCLSVRSVGIIFCVMHGESERAEMKHLENGYLYIYI
jgi:uncharacterized metal-binding protein